MLADDPTLDVRLPGVKRQPLRAVLDSTLRTPASARLFSGGGPVHIFCVKSDPVRRRELIAAGAGIHEIESDARGRPGIAAVLRELAALEVNDVYAECGPTLAGELIAGGWVDELELFLGPHLFGPGARAFAVLGDIAAISDPPLWHPVWARRAGRDVRIRLLPSASRGGSE